MQVNSRMMSALAISGVIALAAGGATVLYLNAANERSVRGQEAVQVWVAKSAISRGSTLESVKSRGALVQELVPVRSAPSSALKDLPKAKEVAASDIAAGEILMTGRFVDESAIGPQMLQVPAGKVAAAATLKDFQRVGSFVKPGDFVAVYYFAAGKTSVLFSRVQVLGVGTASEDGSAGTGKDDKVPTSVMTLALSPIEAKSLVPASNNAAAHPSDAALQFALLPAGESVPGGK